MYCIISLLWVILLTPVANPHKSMRSLIFETCTKPSAEEPSSKVTVTKAPKGAVRATTPLCHSSEERSAKGVKSAIGPELNLLRKSYWCHSVTVSQQTGKLINQHLHNLDSIQTLLESSLGKFAINRFLLLKAAHCLRAPAGTLKDSTQNSESKALRGRSV